MKLTKEQINRIKELSKKGKSTYEIARELNKPQSTIYYWTMGNKEKLNARRRKKYNSKSPEERRQIYLRKREYQKAYRKKRYHKDKKFREKIQKMAREYKQQK
jgi:IS30 family transposase